MNSIPDKTLEQYQLGELPQEKMKEIDEMIKTDKSLRQRIEAIKISNKEILNQYTPPDMTRVIMRKANDQFNEKKTEKKKRGYFPGWYFFTPFAAAAVILFALFLPVDNQYISKWNKKSDITRMKGEQSKIFIYKKTQGNAVLLKQGSTIKQNDLLQIAYQSSEKRFGSIVSIDGRGTVTLHMPLDSKNAQKLSSGRKTSLPESYELDDAPGFERFFLITSEKKFKISIVLNAAKKLAREPSMVADKQLPLNEELSQFSILLKKENIK